VTSLELLTIGIVIVLAAVGIAAAARALGASGADGKGLSANPEYVTRNVIASEPSDPNLVTNFRVFDAKATPRDRLPSDLARLFDALAEAERDTGRSTEHLIHGVEPRRSRLLLEVNSPSPRKIYGVVDRSGAVCYAITGGIAARCVGQLISGISIGLRIEDTEAGRRLYVHGLVADDVRTVDVLVNGTAFSATIGRNVFFIELPAEGVRADDIDGVRVTSGLGTYLVRIG
jgi:hypothetical protein